MTSKIADASNMIVPDDDGFIEQLASAADETQLAHIVEKTRQQYLGYIAQYKEFCKDHLNCDLMEHPRLIKAFIQKKCGLDDNNDGLSYSTADKIRSSLVQYYKKMMDYDDGWKKIKNEQGTVIKCIGNPLHSSEVGDFMKGLKKLKRKAGERAKSAKAILLPDMEKIDNYLFGLDDCGRRKNTIFSEAQSLEIKAIISVSWICMLRIDETLQLQQKDIDVGLVENGEEYIAVTLHDRKTDHNKAVIKSS